MANDQHAITSDEHWDSVYTARGADGVSWFQQSASTSLALIEELDVSTEEAVVDVGGGASPLVDSLVERRFRDIVVLDLSARALELARERLGDRKQVSWVRHDVLQWHPGRQFGLWHDRAVFHFLTDPTDQRRYLAVLRSVVRPGGAVVIGTFAEDGPQRCSGLPVARYSAAELVATLGDGFELVHGCREIHTTPTGNSQSFTWVAGTVS